MWRADYNTYRPHEALGQVCPATLFAPSARVYPEESAAWKYPADHHVRQVNVKGYINWRNGAVYRTEGLRGQTVALAKGDDADGRIKFANSAWRCSRMPRDEFGMPG